MQNKTTVKYQLTLLRMAMRKRQRRRKSDRERQRDRDRDRDRETETEEQVEKRLSYLLLLRMQIGAAAMENTTELPKEIKSRTSTGPSNPSSGMK
jgi:hypothetical protein